jgi:hypothetical protein
MATGQASNPTGAPPVRGGRFTWRGLCSALAFGLAAGAIGAWVAAETAKFYGLPVLLFPILVGVLVGATMLGLVRFAQIGHRPTIVVGVAVAAAVAVAGQRLLGEGSTEGWAAWLVDGLLTLVAAVIVVAPALRVPYCDRCGSWYRTMRNGRIDERTARRLAETCSVEEVEHLHSPRYRLSRCQGGCGPTRCELSWAASGASVDLVQVWLDDRQWERVVAILDELEREEQNEE